MNSIINKSRLKHPEGKFRGGGYLLACSLLLGLFPLVVVISEGNSAPFMFTAAWNLGASISFFTYLYFKHPKLISIDYLKTFSPKKDTFFLSLNQIRNKDLDKFPWNWQVFLSLLYFPGAALYAWSFDFLPEFVATALGESSPLFIAVTLPLIMKEEKKFDINFRTIVLFVFVSLGAVLVVYSALNSDAANAALGLKTIFGLILVLIWVILVAALVLQFGWIENIASQENGKSTTYFVGKNESKIVYDKNAHKLLLSGIGYLFGCIIGFILAIAVSNSFDLRNFLIAFGFGIVIPFLDVYFWGIGTIRSAYNPNIQSVQYLTPVFGIIFLWLASYYGGVNADLFFLGLVAIIVGNVMVNFKTENRFGLASLVVALWLSGWVVLFRDSQLDAWLGQGNWFLSGESYFAVLALSATAFTLLLAFRITRISTRTAEEERLVYSLLGRLLRFERKVDKTEILLDKLLTRGYGYHFLLGVEEKHGFLLQELEVIDKSKDPREFEDAYKRARCKIEKEITVSEKGSGEEQYLLETQAELDALTHSKQYGREYGEPTAVVFLGLLTLTIALLTRPEGAGLTGIIFDGFSFVFAGTIAFLTLHIFDLHSERSTSILEKQKEQSGRYRVEFRREGQIQEWWLSIACAVTVLVVVSVLIWQKWI